MIFSRAILSCLNDNVFLELGTVKPVSNKNDLINTIVIIYVIVVYQNYYVQLPAIKDCIIILIHITIMRKKFPTSKNVVFLPSHSKS